jgi:hypothetical protein
MSTRHIIAPLEKEEGVEGGGGGVWRAKKLEM